MNYKTVAIVLIVLVGFMAGISFSEEPAPSVQPSGEVNQIQKNDENGKQTFNADNLIKGLKEDGFWWVALGTLILGMIGGVVYELIILQGCVEWPHFRTKAEVTEEKSSYAIYQYMFDLGTAARMIVGAMAALVGLWVFSPDGTFSWLTISIVAGSAGTSIFRSLQDRLLAAMAQKDVSEMKSKFKTQADKLEELKENLESQSPRPATALEKLAEVKALSDPWL